MPVEYTGRTKKQVGTKRRTRELIALEFEKYGSVEAAFVAAYPQAKKMITALATAIRKRKGLRRKSRNGTPEERDSREPATGDSDSEEVNESVPAMLVVAESA
ncbi:hypothetical protein AX15_006557 [Amanita polypyramis BW_CC]|nr:hypothetical protein AX15_006557 [Amanita polypyramis BW_CC]